MSKKKIMNNKILISLIVFLLISCNDTDNNNKNKPQTTPSYTSKKKNIDIKTIISDNNSIVSMAINNNKIYTKAYKGNINIWDMDGKKIAEIKDSNFTHSLTVGDKYIYAASSLDSSIKLWDKNNYTLDKILPTDNNVTLMYDVKIDDKYFYSTYYPVYYKNGVEYTVYDNGLIIINKYTGNTVKRVENIRQYSIDDRFLYVYFGGGDISIFDKNTINIYDKINAKDYYDGQEPYLFIYFMKVIGNEIYINVKNRLLVLNKNNKEIIYSIKQDDRVKNILADDNYIYIFIDDNIINAFDRKNKKMINNIFKYNDRYDLSSNFF